MNRPAKYILLTLCLPIMACSNSGADTWRETFGLNRKGPDEFQVVARPPLTVPPDFNLAAPKEGAEYTPATPATDQAHNRLLGTDNTQSPALAGTSAPVSASAPPQSNGLFMAPANDTSNTAAAVPGSVTSASAPIPGVSSGVLMSSSDSQFLNDAGATNPGKNIRQTIDSDNQNNVLPKSKNFFLFGNSTDDPEVDPTKEKQRIDQDKAQNLPPNTGDTPTVDQPKSLLGNIFR